MSAIHMTVGNDGIATLVMDMPGRSMNVLNAELLEPLKTCIEQFEHNPNITGLIITSGKKDFVAGADIEMVQALQTAEQAYQAAETLKAMLRRLEKSTKPVVAALNGTALGGGLEIALACNHRVALDNPKAKFGLPEIKIGLLPGGGGTQRLPRLIGIQNALPLMLEGKELSASAAFSAGIVHALAPTPELMMQMARDWCVANPKVNQPWDDRKFRFPGGDSKSPAVAQVLAIGPSMTNAKTWGNYPAAQHIMSSVFEGGLLDIDNALQVESRYFAACVMSQESRNMINTLWVQLNAIKKGQSRPQGIQPSKVAKVGILGAGMMGAGIAYVSAKAGIRAVLLDTTQEAADKGKAYSQQILDKAVSRGKSTVEKRDALLALIHPTTRYEDLDGCDLIVEAVFEDRDIKATVTQKAEAVINKTAVFASNTSTLPITGLAKASVRPANFIGLHFFSPVDKMPLVEIIVGEQTSDETLARGFDYVQQIGKTPIVVNDSRGFYTSRVFATYIMEGAAMLKEGVHPRTIEVAGLQSGMPMPPLALHDEVSLSLSLHIIEQTKKDLAAEGKTYNEHPGESVVRNIAQTHGRIGKKSGKGYYDYGGGGDGKDKSLWSGLVDLYPTRAEQPSVESLVERFMMIQANESARCMQEGVVRSVADTNIGSIFGWGFAPFHGGTLQYINAMGLPRFVERAQQLAEQLGERFSPPRVLIEKAASGQTFTDNN